MAETPEVFLCEVWLSSWVKLDVHVNKKVTVLLSILILSTIEGKGYILCGEIIMAFWY